MKRGRVFFAVAVIVGALGWVAAKGLTSALVYYNTPSDLLAKGASAYGEQARLGGLVVPGSVHDDGDVIRFVVTDGTNHMTVLDTGGVPALFRAGQGVVVEGVFGRDGSFHADTVLVKHNGVYRPPSPGETPHTADLAGT